MPSSDSPTRALFGTDGIRGLSNRPPIDAPTALRVGAALGFNLRSRGRPPLVVIGRDTRLSGLMLHHALTAGLCASGVETLSVGILPTPGIAHLTRHFHASAGVVISASHNPFEDNGIKIFSGDGFKLPDKEEIEIERFIREGAFEDLAAAPSGVGRSREEEADRLYADFLVDSAGGPLDGLRIVVDCAHGAAYRIAPAVFERLGASVTVIGASPDGRNINQDFGSLHPERLQEAVRRHSADLGAAFDGDADRVIFVDAEGRVVDGDQIMAVCARHLDSQGKLNHRTLVATQMSNLGLEKAMEGLGVRVVRTAVGDRYVVEEMRKHGYSLGGEQSGHLIFLDPHTTGDGVFAAIRVAALTRQTRTPLHELCSFMPRFPQVLKNLVVGRKLPLQDLPRTQASIKRAEEALDRNGRVLVRYSGTENKVRVMIEGPAEEQIGFFCDDILQSLRAELN